MDQLLHYPAFPRLLSTLVFLPLAGTLPLLFVTHDNFARYWSLFKTTVGALHSILLITGFDTATAKFQFAEQATWVESLNIQYVLGLDGISILLVTLTTFIMPICVLASWS